MNVALNFIKVVNSFHKVPPDLNADLSILHWRPQTGMVNAQVPLVRLVARLLTVLKDGLNSAQRSPRYNPASFWLYIEGRLWQS
jgi:hypothetical protein